MTLTTLNTTDRVTLSQPRSRTLVICLLVLFGLTLGSSAFALSFDHIPSLEEILGKSSLVVHAEVLEVSSQLLDSSDPEGVVYTTATLMVQKGYRGAVSGDILQVRYIGGMMGDGNGMGIPGVPWLTQGRSIFYAANDSIHPFFGPLYADLGLRNIVEEGTQTYVLTAHHSPMLLDENEPVRGVQCVPSERYPGQCDAWLDNEGEPVEGPGEGVMTLADFDAWVVDKLGEAPRDPVQALPDDASFRAALASWWQQIHIPAADSGI